VVNKQRAFHELATIIAGENAFASKIKIRALKALAVYDALVRRIIPTHFFAFSPSSTRRRMASERPGSSSCFAAQRSTFARNASERRIARTGSFPVAGRPTLFFSITLFDVAMNKYYQNSEPRGSANFRPGSNPNQMRINRMAQATRVL